MKRTHQYADGQLASRSQRRTDRPDRRHAPPAAILGFSAAIAASLCVLQCGNIDRAEAAGSFVADSDILGIKLTMSRDDAKALVSSKFPNSKIVELPVQLGTPEYKISIIPGFMVDITTKEDQANNQSNTERAKRDFEAKEAAGLGNSPLNMTVSSPGDYGDDKLLVLTNPNQNGTDIFGVSRYKEFTKANMTPVKALLDAFIEKYGQPSLSKFGTSFTWMGPGVLEKTQKPVIVRCSLESDGESFLYENPKLVSTQSIGLSFAFAIKNINAGNKLPYYNISKCGTVLQLNLGLSDDRLYATSMSVVLIDLTKARAELKQFASDFSLHANAAKQDKLSKDSQNKPRL